jgi:hypothetical protein
MGSDRDDSSKQGFRAPGRMPPGSEGMAGVDVSMRSIEPIPCSQVIVS